MTASEKMNKTITWFLIPWICVGFTGTIYLAVAARPDLMALPLLFNFLGVLLALGFILYSLHTEHIEK